MTEEQFLKDVASHQMTVMVDHGLYRHLRLRNPEMGYIYGFDLITWPGHLCICGDMGTYVFKRLEDMLEFFRKTAVNPRYWSEKLEAVDKSSGYVEYDHDGMQEHVKEILSEMPEETRSEIEEEVIEALKYADDESAVRSALTDIITQGRGQPFEDLWEFDSKRFTEHFLWCCHAIRWAVARYDELKNESTKV